MFQRIASAVILLVALVSVSPARAADAGAAPRMSAGSCTRFFVRWAKDFSFENDQVQLACRDVMGIDKFCADRDSRVVVGYLDAPGTFEGQTRTLKCTPSFHPD